MTNEINVKLIIQNAASLLEKQNVEHLPQTTFTKYIIGYSIPESLASHREKIQDRLKLIYWAVSGVQIELGHMLIAIDSYNKAKEFKNSIDIELSYSFFIHHYFLSIECIYRAWERVSRVLYFYSY